jgi:hypothetical protein
MARSLPLAERQRDMTGAGGQKGRKMGAGYILHDVLGDAGKQPWGRRRGVGLAVSTDARVPACMHAVQNEYAIASSCDAKSEQMV